MGKIRKNPKVKLFFACTYNPKFAIEDFYDKIIKDFGNISYFSTIYDFSNFTNYYEKEMGQNLSKQIISIDGCKDIENLHKIKLYTNNMEQTYSSSGDRILNIDPGYLTEAKVLLFTTKNNIHRIYIGDGIFAEITLTYRKGSYSPNPMTYSDYKQDIIINFFNNLRHELKTDEEYQKSKSIL